MEDNRTLKCDKHNEKEVKFISLEQDDTTIFKCRQCIVEQNLSNNKLLILQQLSNNNDQQFISNWPPNIEQQLMKSFKEIATSAKRYRLIDEIQKFFDDFKTEITNRLDIIKKNVIIDINNLKDDETQIMEKYKQICQVEALQNILKNQNINKNDMQNQFQQQFQIMNQKSEEYRQIIEQQNEEYTKKANQIADFPLFNQVKEISIRIINQIQSNGKDKNQIDQNKMIIQQNQQLEKVDEAQNSNYLKENSQYDVIAKLSLILSKYNSSSVDDYFQSFKDFQQKIDGITSSLKDHYQDFNQNLFNKKNLKLIEKAQQGIVSCIKQTGKESLNINKLQSTKNQSINEINQIVIKLMEFDNNQLILINQLLELSSKQCYKENSSYQYFFNVLRKEQSYLQNEQKLQQILQQFPIYDLMENKHILLKFKIESWSQNQNQVILNQQQNYSQQIPYQPIQYMKSDIILDNNKKYIIRFKFDYTLAHYNCFIGLSTKNQQQQDQFSYYINPCKNQILGMNEIKTFSLTHSGNPYVQDTKIIEMRVCISENILIFTDYPQYRCGDSYKSQNRIDINSIWQVSIRNQTQNNYQMYLDQFIEVDKLAPL